MTHLTPLQAEEHLQHVAEQFTQWRQSRPTPRGCRIPAALWTEALTLAEVLSVTRVARHLQLKPQALNRRRGETGTKPPSPSAPFIEVAPPPWRSCTAEVEVQRPDGTRLRITYSEASPVLVPLLQTFLEAR
jgi:hypothetical protein